MSSTLGLEDEVTGSLVFGPHPQRATLTSDLSHLLTVQSALTSRSWDTACQMMQTPWGPRGG